MIDRTLSTIIHTRLALVLSRSALRDSSAAGVHGRRTHDENVKNTQHAAEMRRKPKTCRYLIIQLDHTWLIVNMLKY